MADNDLIRRIKTTLKQRGITQREFAAMLGKKETEISRWLSGRVGIGEQNLQRIEEALGRPLSRESIQQSGSHPVRIGIVGTGSIAGRFATEAAHVQGTYISAAYNPDAAQLTLFCEKYGITLPATSYQQLLDNCDAVYVASPFKTHYAYAKDALEHNKHVLCETPFTATKAETLELYNLAKKKNLTLMIGLKTAYCPSYKQIIEVAKSGIVGDVVDINLSLTTLVPEPSERIKKAETGKMAEGICFNIHPVFELLGNDYSSIHYYARCLDSIETYCRALVVYPNAIATLQVGVGVKSEGNMIISGTKGYIYVPAPWWRTDYFEVRFEDQNRNSKYYYRWEGEGLRYELQEFINAISQGSICTDSLTIEQSIQMAKAVQQFQDKKNYTLL